LIAFSNAKPVPTFAENALIVSFTVGRNVQQVAKAPFSSLPDLHVLGPDPSNPAIQKQEVALAIGSPGQAR
jgi:hypothetical protein